MEEKYDSEEKFDPGAETEAGKEAVADLDPKNEQEKYLLKFRKIQAKSVKKIIYWFIHKFVNNAFDPEGVGNGLTSRTTSINPTISSAGATKVSLIPDTLFYLCLWILMNQDLKAQIGLYSYNFNAINLI